MNHKRYNSARALIMRLAAGACLILFFGRDWTTRAQSPLRAAERYRQAVWTTQDGLPHNAITALLQTRDGYVWVSTTGGLARFDGVKFTVFDVANTPALESQPITALYEDREGTLWIGTEHGGLIRYVRGAFVAYTEQDGLPGHLVRALAEDARGILWVGTDRGLAQFAAERFITYTTREGLADHAVDSIRQQGRSVG